MISSELLNHFGACLSEKVVSAKPLSGGDINQVYVLETLSRKAVVKINNASRFPGIFKAEAEGLEELRASKTFTIPQVLSYCEKGDTSFLFLQHIDSGVRSINFWEMFGIRLASLHQLSKSYFGFKGDNYIGSLPQYNHHCCSASEFYISQRLEPQFTMAIQKSFSFSGLDNFYKNIENEIPEESSSLVHGDLWGGNYMVDGGGKPCLIDPAVAYAPREMDIGMMHLFGGFDAEVFEVYNEVFPLEKGWKNRIPIFQLYYLLVHLNLFGSSYYNSVRNIVNKYS